MVDVDEIVLEIFLDEIDGIFIFGFEETILKYFEEDR